MTRYRFVEWANASPTGLMLATIVAPDLPPLRPDDDLLVLYCPGFDRGALEEWAAVLRGQGHEVVLEGVG